MVEHTPLTPQSGFTLIELIISITIIASISTFVVFRFGVVDSYHEEKIISKLQNLPPYLLQRSMTEGKSYGMQFDLTANNFKVGVLADFGNVNSQFSSYGGVLSQELIEFTAPIDLASGQGLIDIPDSSISELNFLPSGSRIYRITTSYGTFEDGLVPIVFSPLGGAEFTVINYQRNSGEVTLLIDPYSGVVTRYEGFEKFSWNLASN